MSAIQIGDMVAFDLDPDMAPMRVESVWPDGSVETLSYVWTGEEIKHLRVVALES